MGSFSLEIVVRGSTGNRSFCFGGFVSSGRTRVNIVDRVYFFGIVVELDLTGSLGFLVGGLRLFYCFLVFWFFWNIFISRIKKV